MGYKIEITDNTADALMRDILVQDYRGLLETKAALEARSDLEPYEQEDLETDRRFLAAMEIMLEYYLTSADYHTVTNRNPA